MDLNLLDSRESPLTVCLNNDYSWGEEERLNCMYIRLK